VLSSRSTATGAPGVTQAGVVPSWRQAHPSPFALGMLRWRNSGPRRARSALGRSRRMTLSCSVSAVCPISIAEGPAF